MEKIILNSLKCMKTQDIFGADECRLEITIDGTFQPPLRQSIKAGQEWDLNQAYPFNTTVEVKLWEEDPFRQSALIGKTTISAAPCGIVEVAFNESASYVLSYSVSDAISPDGSVNDVQDAILKFENSPLPGLWPYVLKSELINDIRQTIGDPLNVNQGSTPLCGPASIIYKLAAQYPRRYVEILQNLFETGQFQARTHTIKPSTTLVNSRIRKDVTLADWILMSTLRDTENLFSPVEESSSIFVMGFTKPWEMKGWTYELLNFDTTDYDSLIFYGEFEAMQKAQAVVDKGGVVFLMIHSALLGNAKPVVPYPDHWITFLGNLSIDDGVWNRKGGHIRFDCYSWGQRIHIDIEEKLFSDYTWGAVYGMP
jgi:hypothetical protein